MTPVKTSFIDVGGWITFEKVVVEMACGTSMPVYAGLDPGTFLLFRIRCHTPITVLFDVSIVYPPFPCFVWG